MKNLPQRRRQVRWRQFSLRTLLIVVTLASLPLAGYVWLRSKAQRQAQAVAALREMGAAVRYSFEPPPVAPGGTPASGGGVADQESAMKRWARRNLGRDFAHHVDSIALSDTARSGDVDRWAAFFEHARELQGVTSLELRGATIRDSDLAPLPFLETLQRLAIDRSVAGDGAFAPLARATQLRTLELTNTPIGDATLARIQADEMRELVLCGTRVSDRGLARLATMPRLERLSLSATSVTGRGLADIGPKPLLKQLELVNTPFVDESLPAVGAFTQLEELLFVATHVTGSRLNELAPLTRLKHLNLAGSPIDDAGLSRLPLLPACTHLDLSFTDVTDEGIEHARLPPNLQQIVLTGTFVRDGTLSRLQDLPKLAVVGVKYTDVTPMGVQQFQAARPQCAVIN